MSPVPVRIRRLSIEHPDAQSLIDKVQQVYVSLYGSQDETPLEPGYFDPPQGAFFVAYLGDRPVGTGAWRFRPEAAAELEMERPAEIKRMYVDPSARGLGVARRLLGHLEATAAERGATHLILETGEPQREAIGLYTSSGYSPVIPFGHYRHEAQVRCFARSLDWHHGS